MQRAVHEAPWIDGDTTTAGGIYVALEMAEQAYQAHMLPYEQGLSNMHLHDPRRFTWIYDEGGEADDCVKIRRQPHRVPSCLAALGWIAICGDRATLEPAGQTRTSGLIATASIILTHPYYRYV